MAPSIREAVTDPAALPLLDGHRVAVSQAVLVTLLWSSSYVLIKEGLAGGIPALTFAGLRYVLAFACLAPVAAARYRDAIRGLDGRDWAFLAALGVVYYAVTQGAQFLALVYLPAVTVSLMLNFTPALVTLAGIPALGERPTARQWVGTAVAVGGAVLYFYPVALPAGRAFGLAVMTVGLGANAAASVMGRYVNRDDRTAPLVITTVSMGIGSLLLLASGVAVQGLPALSPVEWGIVAWLAVVNTAFAFTLWNHTLQRLTAVESSVINNTMLVQIAVLGWVFLGETLSVGETAALGVVLAGTILVEIRR